MATFKGSARGGSERPQMVTAWSWSRLKTYLQCPFKLKCSAIDKLKEPESAAMLEGKRIHKLSEDFLLGKIPFPEELKFFKEDYDSLLDCGPSLHVEFPITFRDDLTLTTWFAKDAWLRLRFDCFIKDDDATAVVIDIKTGKQRNEDMEQCELFALATFLAYPDINTVTCELWYTQTGNVPKPRVYQREALATLQTKWFDKAALLLHDTEFLPTPNGLCGWCEFRHSNGGPCRFS